MLYDSTYMILRRVKIIETKCRMPEDERRQNKELWFNGYRVSVLQDEKGYRDEQW